MNWPEIAGGLRLAAGVPFFLRRSISHEEATAFVREGLANREDNFLRLLRTLVYPFPASPYRQLLEHAGCDYEDVASLVGTEGLEGALAALRVAGVYLTVDEVKGRSPAIRGSARIEVGPERLGDPRASREFVAGSSGRTARAIQVGINLEALRFRAMSTRIAQDLQHVEQRRLAMVAVPGSAALVTLLSQTVRGLTTERWFTPVDPRESGLATRYWSSARVASWSARLAGVRLPAPEFVPLAAPLPVARWMRTTLDNGAAPWLWASSSWAVEVCRAAQDAGFDLAGAEFTTTGEPTTAARLAVIQASGGHAVPSYAAIEAGVLGHGCLTPSTPNDLHLTTESFAFIHADNQTPGIPTDALLVTTLDAQPRTALLNAALGDAGALEDRACACPLHHVGWTTHLTGLRSYARRTTAGMTLHDRDLAVVLEQILPEQFGGSPTDFQLIEHETAGGHGRLTLRVHPRLGELDEHQVQDAFIRGIERLGDPQRAMARVWRDANLVDIDRLAPHAVGGRKIAQRILDDRSASDQ